MTFTYRTEDCSQCGGGGELFHVARISGEYMDADMVGECCPYCDGTGEQSAYCAGCGNHEPLDDNGECQRCHDAHELTVAMFNDKYGLAECVGDPLLKRRAA
jgi:DnaJ-class molecular chaperone